MSQSYVEIVYIGKYLHEPLDQCRDSAGVKQDFIAYGQFSSRRLVMPHDKAGIQMETPKKQILSQLDRGIPSLGSAMCRLELPKQVFWKV